jgi:hypothetical protein
MDSPFYQQFPNEQACLEYLEAARWPNGRACPHCGSLMTYKFKDGKLFKCGENECHKQFSAKVGTIFTDSHIPLQDWFLAVFILTSLKKGVSSIQLAKYLNITQKSSWFVLQRIRYAMEYGTFEKPLEGTLEAEETYIGGNHKHIGKFDNKMAVLDLVEKKNNNGHIKTLVTKQADASVAPPFIRAAAKPGSEIQTDECRIYTRLKREYPHQYGTHKNFEYSRNGASTNTVEGAWNHLKLGLRAIYLGVSAKHLSKILI